jgi:hypothetical protein
MRTRTTPIIALAATASLLLGGTAALAISSDPKDEPRPGSKSGAAAAPAEVRSGRVSFRPVTGKGFPEPKIPVKKRVAPVNDAFARLGADAFAAYGTGTVLHSDPELSERAGVTVDLSVADAVYSAQALSPFTDELGRPIVSGLPALSGQAHARAVTLDPPDAAGIDVDLGGPADSKAPPTSRPVVRETTTNLEPVVKADLLRAEAAARAVSTGCVIGDDLARAAASADDTEVGDVDLDPESTKPLLSLSADDPGRAVSTTKSRSYLEPIPGRPGRFAAVSELRQTIAPVTFGLPGVDEKFTLEVGGEWVMRAVADGTKGEVALRPENSEDHERPAIRLFQGEELIAVGLGDVDRTGIFIDGDPVGDIRIGGEARAIFGGADSKPAQTATRVAAAADMVVVRLFEVGAELRIGHMEVGLAVPAGGVKCPGIGLTKASDPAAVRPGDPFAWNLEVFNPNDCVLDQVKVVDTPTASQGVDWKAVTSVPRATRAPNGDLVFDNIGALASGERRLLQLNAQIEPGSELGAITNRASAVGVCGEAPLAGTAETTTYVGMTVVPAVPRPPAGVPAGERPTRRESAGTTNPGESAAAPAGPSGSATRSASASSAGSRTATRSASAARAATAVDGQRLNAQANQAPAGAAPLARTGGETAPYVALALGLLGMGRVFRLATVRRRDEPRRTS